jgi:nucleotidyltransferase substrate binding protein (TIGR01987 family)
MTEENQDIRWMQRFNNYLNAYENLSDAVAILEQRPLNRLEEQGLIQYFEYTHELAWKVMKDFLEAQGYKDLFGSKNATRLAFKQGLIADGEIWMEMIEARNETSHTYDQTKAEAILEKIIHRFYAQFVSFTERLTQLAAAHP